MATTSGVDLSQVHRMPSPLPFGDGFTINTYLIDAKPLTLIDTGIRGEKSVETLERGLAERGYKIEDLRQIVITHSHIDHYGCCAELVRRSGAKVFAHPIERVHMEHFPSGTNAHTECVAVWFKRWGIPDEISEASLSRNQFLAAVREDVGVDVSVTDGQRIAIDGFDLEAIHVPGHCQGHLCYWNDSRKILFTGDHLLPDISPVPMLALGTDPDAEKPRSIIQFLDSLDKIDRWPARLGLPSHGDYIDDTRALTRSYRLHIERRSRKMRKILADGPKSPYEVGQAYFPKRIESELYLVMSEVIGHMELLVHRGLAEERVDDEGRIRYKIAAEEWLAP